MIDSSTLEKLRKLDTPTVCNLIELFDIRPRNQGYMDERIQSHCPELPPMVGFASPVTVRSIAPPQTSSQPKDGDSGEYSWLQNHVKHFEEIAGDIVVVQQDLDSPKVAATFGEVMCSTYQSFGAVGIVSSGSARDIDEVKALGFHMFTDGAICSHGYFHTVDIHVPVNVGGLQISVGDLLHGDVNGVTTIPLEIASELFDVAEEFTAAERIILDVVQGRKATLDELAQAQAESKEMIGAISRRVSRQS